MNTLTEGLEAGETNLSVKMIPIDRIVCRLTVRRMSANGLERIKASMQRFGFLENFPLMVLRLADNSYQLIDGNHRYARAFQQLLDLRFIEVQGRTFCVLFEDLLFGSGNLHSLREEKVNG